MDIYDALAYMNLKQEDFYTPIFTTNQSSRDSYDLETVPSNNSSQPNFDNDIVIVDDDDTVSEPIPQQKFKNKMKRIHIPDAVIKPFHNRYNKNSITSNEQQHYIRTTSTTRTNKK